MRRYILLLISLTAYGQTEAALRSYFEGKTVLVKLDMPASKDGVDVYPKAEPKADFKSYSTRLRRYGISLHNGDSVTITTIRVKDKNIEFQLGGGGYGVAGDETSSVGLSTTVSKSSRERDLERDIAREKNQRVKESMERELSRIRDQRRREEARLRAEKTQLEEIKSSEIAQKRLLAGSRFNIWYPDKYLKETIPSPQEVMLILNEYVDFGRIPSGFEGKKSGYKMPRVNLKKGMTMGQVMTMLGAPRRSSERSEGALKVVTNTFETGQELIDVDFVKDVVVDYRIRPR